MNTPQIEANARAILVGLRISNWSGKRYDKEVSEAAAAAFNADPSAGRFNKNCIPSTTKVQKTVEKVIKKGKKKGQTKTEAVTVETNSLIELNTHLAEIRRFVYENTLAWSDGARGWRVLPITNWTPFITGYRERQDEFLRLLPVFVADYADLVRMSKLLLNGMFKDADYPSNIEGEFSLNVEFDRMPGKESGDIRIALAQDDIAMIEASVEARANAGWQAAQDDAVKRLFKVLAKIHERLTTTRVSKRKGDGGETIAATHRDTLVNNARELCDILTRLNVADDPQLEQFRRETELLAAVEPETLRDCPDVAAETAARADDILKRMTGTYGAGLFAGLK